MATLIRANGTVTEYAPWQNFFGSGASVVTPRKIRFDEIQEAVGGYVEPAWIEGHGPTRRVVLTNADAKFTGLPINHKAAEILGLDVMQWFSGGCIAGDVLVGLQKEFQL